MKKLFFRYILGMIPAIAFFNGASAQSIKLTPEGINSPSKEVAYDEQTDIFVVPASVNTKALKDFNKTFKGVDPSWFRTNEGFIAEFKKDDILTRVDYNHKGRFIAMIRRYSEDKLPRNVRDMVNNAYDDYNIFWVTEVTYLNTTAYLVKIEGMKTQKTIRVVDGEMDLYENFKKSK